MPRHDVAHSLSFSMILRMCPHSLDNLNHNSQFGNVCHCWATTERTVGSSKGKSVSAGLPVTLLYTMYRIAGSVSCSPPRSEHEPRVISMQFEQPKGSQADDRGTPHSFKPLRRQTPMPRVQTAHARGILSIELHHTCLHASHDRPDTEHGPNPQRADPGQRGNGKRKPVRVFEAPSSQSCG